MPRRGVGQLSPQRQTENIMNRWQIVRILALGFGMLAGWLSGGEQQGLLAGEDGKKEREVITIQPEYFQKVKRAENRPTKEDPLQLEGGFQGYYDQDGKTVILEHEKIKLAPGDEQRFALYRQQPYHWYAQDPALFKDVTKEMIKADKGNSPPIIVGKAGLDKGFSFTGRKGKITLQFDYKKSKDAEAVWVFKIEVEG
jgi:hypothetical protein